VFYCVLIVWYHGFGWHARHTAHGVHPKRDRRKRYVVRRDSDESQTTNLDGRLMPSRARVWARLINTGRGEVRANYAIKLTWYT